MTRDNLKYNKKVKCDGPTDGQTNGPTDRRTDKAGCRVACTRLKNSNVELDGPKLRVYEISHQMHK